VDFARGLVDSPRGGDDQPFQPPRKLPAEIRHMPMVGMDHGDFEGGVGQVVKTEPRAGDQKMNIGPLVVHVLDAVVGAIVLHSWPRHLAPAPSRLAAGKALSRRCLTKDPPVELRGDAIVVNAAAGDAVRS